VRQFDVFNGDADGICALRQLRLARPVEEVELVTGLKRDIALVERVGASEGDRVTVLDVSLERNRDALLALLARGVQVHYFDHHFAGDIPDHPALTIVIDTKGLQCTSSLVDRHVGGRFRNWAVAGAFGDNFPTLAWRFAQALEMPVADLESLRELGEVLNYNAYGAEEADVMVPPADLYRVVSRYDDPVVLARSEPLVARLADARTADLERSLIEEPVRNERGSAARVLPDESWSRRVSGTLANHLAYADPKRAHAVVSPQPGGGYKVSIRSPGTHGPMALEFCRRYATGGGRPSAAGIDLLEAEGLEAFLDAFARAWTR
jgi:hypothetical protein